MYQQDWMMRQIQMLVQFVAKLFWGKDFIEYQIEDDNHLSQTDCLYKDLKVLLENRELCKAEDLLFEHLEKDNQDYLKLAIDFYQSINELDDPELEAANFSREEIKSGLDEIMRVFGLPPFAV